jgi:hypothetical protein
MTDKTFVLIFDFIFYIANNTHQCAGDGVAQLVLLYMCRNVITAYKHMREVSPNALICKQLVNLILVYGLSDFPSSRVRHVLSVKKHYCQL